MNLGEIVETGLSEGGAQVVLASHSRSVNCRLANNTVTTNGSEESTSAGAVAIESGQVGVQTGDVQDRGQVLALADEARGRARRSPKAPDAMPLLTPGEAAVPEPDAGDPEDEGLTAIVDPLQRVLEQARSDGLRLYGYAQASDERELLGTATGVRLPARRRAGSLSLTLKTDDLKRSVWAGSLATRLGGMDPEAMYRNLRERLGWTAQQRQLPPGHYEVILEPSATAEMIVRLSWEMHARGADEDRTVFAAKGGSRVGEKMYASSVTIESDPRRAEMRVPGFLRVLSSSEYSSVFDNGLPSGRTVWVERGVQQDLVCPRRWAQDHGHPIRPDSENLRMEGTGTSLQEMISASERALLITSLWYIRDVDPSALLLTGLTRDGVFLIEHGQITAAVNNFRFNESPVGVLQRTIQIGAPELALSREVGDSVFVEAPPLRVEGFFMSSVSDAI